MNKEEIFRLRKSLFLSQQELADKLSVSQRIVSYWERGLYSPNLEHQAKLKAIAKMNKKRLYIYDLPSLLKKEGKEDFLTMLLNLLRDGTAEYIAAACDDMQGVFLPERYKTFHTDQASADSSFIIELEQTKEIIQALGISVVLKYGVETEEILATLTDRALFLGFEVDIITSDVLLLQLLEPKIRVHFNFRKGIVVDLDEERFKKEYSLEPKKYPDYLSLVGLKEKSIPGVGIDEESALKLINSFKTLENMLENIEKVESKFRNKLTKEQAIALIGKRLAILSPDVELSLSPEDCLQGERDNERLFSLAKEQSIRSLLQFLEERKGRKESEYHTVLKEDELEELLSFLRAATEFAIHLETTSPTAMKAEIVGLSLSLSPYEAYYIPVLNDHLQSKPQLEKKTVLEKLKPILENEKISKIGHNIKYDFILLRRNGIDLKGIDFDTQIASYLLSPEAKGHELDLIAKKYFGYSMTKIPACRASLGAGREDFLSRGIEQIPLSQVPVERVAEYACFYADMTLQAKAKLSSLLSKHDLDGIFYEIEMPLIPVLADMEIAGVKIDLSYLANLRADFEKRKNVLSDLIFKEAGEKFNLNSPKQLSFILFEKIGLQKLSKTKTGYSTKDTVLKELSKEHPLPSMILEYRFLNKLKETIKALAEFQNQETGRVHTSFNQAVTATGRLSSSNPNLQNIPVRYDTGREIRRAFVAEGLSACDAQAGENYLVAADYSQIELRILAHLSKDEKLVEAFINDEDIHAKAASLLFGVPKERVTKEQRRTAKTMNYSIVYGISANSLAKELKISKKEAKKLIDNYFTTYSGVKAYFDKTIEEAEAKGYVLTLMGRRREVKEIQSEKRKEREEGKRIAQNTPVQGSAADLIKVAMIKIADYLKKTKKKTKMLLSVHDELVFEVPQAELEEVKKEVKNIMETAIKLSVPIKVDINVGRNWLEAK